MQRKDEVIAVLNDTYEEGEQETENSQTTSHIDTVKDSAHQILMEDADYFKEDEVSVKLDSSKQEFNDVIDFGKARSMD